MEVEGGKFHSALPWIMVVASNANSANLPDTELHAEGKSLPLIMCCGAVDLVTCT
jgi:hypothetical protein